MMSRFAVRVEEDNHGVANVIFFSSCLITGLTCKGVYLLLER
jgi:hypothetical protein